jgi:hypothetical protein
MNRIPTYLVMAVLGLLFISAGLITMFADNGEVIPTEEAAAILPSPTLTETPTLMPSPTVYVQPTVMVLPTVVVPTQVPVAIEPTVAEPQVLPTIPPTEVVPIVPPTDVLVTPVDVAPAGAEATVVVETPVVVEQVLPTDVPPVDAATPENVVPTEVLPVNPVETAVTMPTDVVVDTTGADGAASGAVTVPNSVPTVSAPIDVAQPTSAVPVAPTTDPAAVVIPVVPTTDPAGALPVVPTSDPAALPIVPTTDPASLPTTVIEVSPTIAVPIAVSPVPAQVSGIVTFADAADYSGIAIVLTLPDGSTAQTVTDAAGAFALPNLIPGSYRLDAGAAGYLSRWTEFTLAEGQILSLPATMLVVGDTNQDNTIDLSDAALIASNFDSPATVLEADINRDGWIDVKDLAMIGADFGRSGPLPWQ